MRLVSTTNHKRFLLSLAIVATSVLAIAQDNSPYSRYGLGDFLPSQHLIARGMGGAAVAYVDAQSINMINPATYADLRIVTFDFAATIDNRTLKSLLPENKFKTGNFRPAYVAVGIPLSLVFDKKKWLKNTGLAFGLRPLSNISYGIFESKRITGIDSATTFYEGNGGLNQAFVGMGKKWYGKKTNLSVGFNTGYTFGRKETSTKVNLENDTVLYYKANTSTRTSFGNFFLSGGIQVETEIGKNDVLRFGLSGSLKTTLNGRQDLIRETYGFDPNSGNVVTIDSVYTERNRRGNIELPATYTAGVMYHKTVDDRFNNKLDKFMITAEYESTQWSNYRFYNQTDKVTNSWTARFGAQLTIDPTDPRGYWNKVAFRTGVAFGKDYINADGNELKTFSVTLGAGLPVKKFRSYDNQFTTINTSVEFGKRGSGANNITENYFRLNFGFSLSDVWFIKRKYD
jgi:archaellin